MSKHAQGRRGRVSSTFRGIEAVEPRVLFSTYTVTTLSDTATGGQTTLRQAVTEANAHAGADTVAFAASLAKAGNAIVLGGGEIDLTDTTGATTITGPGSSLLAVNAGGKSRGFGVSAGVTATISGLTITNGKATVANAAGVTGGGGIYSAGTLTLSADVLSGNTAIASLQGLRGGTPQGLGGGVWSAGNLTVLNSTVSGNSVAVTDASPTVEDYANAGIAAGGGIYVRGMLTLSGDTIKSNTATGYSPSYFYNASDAGPAAGGGVYATGAMTVATTTITANTADAGDAGATGTDNGGSGYGGGIYASATLSISGTTVSANAAYGGNSGFAGSNTGSADGGGIYVGTTFTATGSTVSGNTASTGVFQTSPAPDLGGGVYVGGNATITNSTLTKNTLTGSPTTIGTQSVSAEGGGAYVAGTLQFTTSTASGNTVTAAISDQYNERGGEGLGGGLGVGGTTTIRNSTVSGNTAVGGSGGGYGFYNPTPAGDGDGGGVYATSALTVTNSTVVANAARGGAGTDESQPSQFGHAGSNGGNASGGGISATNGFTLYDSTVTGNTTTAGKGGAGAQGYAAGADGTATAGGVAGNGLADNTILSGNTAAAKPSDLSGTLSSSSGHNLIGAGGGLTNGKNGNQVGVNNPGLSALANYGGSTQIMLPSLTSPALNAGSNALIASGLTLDQRGDPRISGSAVDIGAAEYRIGTITGSVYNDANADGARASTERGLAGFTVFLDVGGSGVYRSADPTATTDANGNYVFTNLASGTYKVEVQTKSNYRLTAPIAGYATVVVNPGQTVAGPAFGETTMALISGNVFLDANGDGKKGSGETNLSGWRVYIDLNRDGKYESSEQSVVTTSTGAWSFNVGAAGTYQVRIVPMTGYKATTPTGGLLTFSVGTGSSRIGNLFGEEKIG